MDLRCAIPRSFENDTARPCKGPFRLPKENDAVYNVTKLASSSPAGRAHAAPARVREYGAPPRATGLVEAGTRGIVYMGICRTKRTPDRDRRPRHFTLYRIRRSFHHRALVPTGRPRTGPRSLSPSVHAPPPSSRVHINQESYPCTSQRPCGHRLGSPLRLADHGHAKPRYSRAGGSARLCPLSHTYSSPASAAHHATDNPPPCQGIPPRVAAPHLARSAYVRTT
jgi:hypothetical protein